MPAVEAAAVAQGEAELLSLQRTAGNHAVSRLVRERIAVPVQRKVGPWLGQHAKAGIDALAAAPPDFPAALTALNGFSLDDIVAILRDAGSGKRTAMSKFIAAGEQSGSLPVVDIPRFVLALRMAGVSAATARRSQDLHDLIRGGSLQEVYSRLNSLAVADQERILSLLSDSHLKSLAEGVRSATGVDVPWLGTLLSGIRGATLPGLETALTWLNGQEIAAGAAWAAWQPADRLAFMSRPRTLKAAGQVHGERLSVMLTAGLVRQTGGEVIPADVSKIEAALAGAQLPAEQRNAVRDYLGLPAPTLPEATAEPVADNQLSGTKGYADPSATTDTSARNLFGISYSQLLDSMQTVQAFGVTAIVAPALAQVLLRADAIARQLIAATEGRPMEASDWGIGSMLGLQPPPHGFHQFGLAVDLDYKTMPYLMHESREAPLDRKLAPIYHRISLLMLGRRSTIPDGPWSYDGYAQESAAMRRYFVLATDPAALQIQLEAGPLDAEKLSQIYNGSVPPPADRAAVLQKMIGADHAQLTAAPERNLEEKLKKDQKPRDMDSPFDPKKGHPDPSQGFLSIRKEIVTALKQADPSVRWGGTDFGHETGDLMHFDIGAGIARDEKTGIYSRRSK